MSVTYYVGTGQAAWNVAVTVGLPVWEEVIPEIRNKIAFRQRHMQTAASYSPLALSTTYTAHGVYGVPNSPSYFLVGEENLTDKGGGVVEFDRVWASVPTTWLSFEDYAYTYPAYIVPISIGSVYTISNITEPATTFFTLTINSSTSGISLGDPIYVSMTFARGSIPYAVQCLTKCAGTGTSSIDIPHFLPGTSAFGSVAGSVIECSGGRLSPETLIVSSRIQHDYAMISNPGVTGTIDTELPALDAFTAIDSVGNRVSSLSTGTATRPNSEFYGTMVRDQTLLVAEQSTRERWMGNIYVRKTRMVPAR
jgi:hypothetical protein